jgi:hypothetical protein
MELLVANEVEAQLRRMPQGLIQYVRREQVETFALNQLPALYAASEVGLQKQMQRAKKEYGEQIRVAVRRALAAIQRDPLKQSVPLSFSDDNRSQRALEKLRVLLNREDITWEHLPEVIVSSLSEMGEAKEQSTAPPGLDYPAQGHAYDARQLEPRQEVDWTSKSAHEQPQRPARSKRVNYDWVTGRPHVSS